MGPDNSALHGVGANGPPRSIKRSAYFSAFGRPGLQRCAAWPTITATLTRIPPTTCTTESRSPSTPPARETGTAGAPPATSGPPAAQSPGRPGKHDEEATGPEHEPPTSNATPRKLIPSAIPCQADTARRRKSQPATTTRLG